jgi:glycosyltransferase involved in cell wall biosynthesis
MSRALGVPCHVAGAKPRLRHPTSVFRCARDIGAVATREGAAVIHSMMGYGHIFGGLAARLVGKPEVWFQHGPPGRLDWLTGRVPTTTIFVNSKFTGDKQKHYHALARRMQVLYPGIEQFPIEEYRERGREFRRVRGFAEDQVVIALPGRLSPMKGQGVLIEAARLLRDEGLRFRVLLIGGPFMPRDEEYAAGLREQVERHRLNDVVEFTGFLSPPYPAMAGCDVIVNASVVPEPCAATVLEGMMLGRAVIAPAAGGSLEQVTDGQDGLLFTLNDATSLAARLRQLVESAELRRKLGEKARETALRRFTIEVMTRDLEAEYDRVVSEAK